MAGNICDYSFSDGKVSPLKWYMVKCADFLNVINSVVAQTKQFDRGWVRSRRRTLRMEGSFKLWPFIYHCWLQPWYNWVPWCWETNYSLRRLDHHGPGKSSKIIMPPLWMRLYVETLRLFWILSLSLGILHVHASLLLYIICLAYIYLRWVQFYMTNFYHWDKSSPKQRHFAQEMGSVVLLYCNPDDHRLGEEFLD